MLTLDTHARARRRLARCNQLPPPPPGRPGLAMGDAEMIDAFQRDEGDRGPPSRPRFTFAPPLFLARVPALH